MFCRENPFWENPFWENYCGFLFTYLRTYIHTNVPNEYIIQNFIPGWNLHRKKPTTSRLRWRGRHFLCLWKCFVSVRHKSCTPHCIHWKIFLRTDSFLETQVNPAVSQQPTFSNNFEHFRTFVAGKHSNCSSSHSGSIRNYDLNCTWHSQD
jgi:hypothetical protein